MNKLYIIGIGFRPFDKRASEIIYNSNLILTTSNRLYELFKEHEEFKEVKDRIKVITNVDETIEFIKSEIRNLKPEIQTVALIASGDPMFHGIGRRAVKEFGKDMVEILPDLSCVQIAFSRIKEPWDDAFLISFHRSGILEKNKYEIDDIPLLLTRHNKIAILTNERNNPTEIAKTLLKSQIPNPKSQIIIYVCERLGYDDEKIIEGAPDVILKMEFLSPNVVILQNRAGEPPPSPPFGKGGQGGFSSETHTSLWLTKEDENPSPFPSPLRGEGWGEGGFSEQKMSKVYFIGAGPGDPELITIKGRKVLDNADVVIYTGSLVNPELLKGIKAEIFDSSKMALDEIVEIMRNSTDNGRTVARLHTGDTSFYSAVSEQIERLRALNIEYEVIPGVSSAMAGAAVLGQELTIPEITQTVIFTRIEGRTPVPEMEKLSELAKHRATMVIFLSVRIIEKVRDELLSGYPDNTPVVVIEKASWPEQRIIRGALKDIVDLVRDADIEKTALIYVGEALKASEKSLKKESRLYNRDFSHGYRK